MQHYAQVTEVDIKEAAELSIINGAKKRGQNVGQNVVQTVAVSHRTGPHEPKNSKHKNAVLGGKNAKNTPKTGILHKVDTTCQMGGIGLEPTTSCVSSRRSSQLS